RHGAGKPGAVEDKCAGGQARRAIRTAIAQILVEERLNSRVGRTQILAQHPFFFVVIAKQRPGYLQKARVVGILSCGLAEGGKLEMKVLNEFNRTLGRGHAIILPPTLKSVQIIRRWREFTKKTRETRITRCLPSRPAFSVRNGWQ